MAFCTLRRAVLGVLLLAVLTPQAGAVIGGQAAAPGAWPFAAALIDGAAADTLAGQICGAVVVAPREVVTAAHCVVPEGSARPRRRSLDIVAGRLRLRGSASARIHVVSVRIDPAFDPESLVNDLAILELASPVSAVAQLDDGATGIAGAPATALGWGSTTSSPEGDFPDAMRQTAIAIEPDANCADAYGDGFNAATMLCAGVPQGGRDTCQGDSGGALVASGASGPVVVGFTSFGGACGQPGAPGAYVRASVAATWLEAGGATTADRIATLPLPRSRTPGVRPLARPKHSRAKQHSRARQRPRALRASR